MTAICQADTPSGPPIYADLYTRAAGDNRSQEFTGKVLEYDTQTVTIQSGSQQKALHWGDLTPSSAFALRSRLIDKTSAHDWLVLGKFGWQIGATQQARLALGRAGQIDKTLKPDADAVLATAPGTGIQPTESDSTPPQNELIVPAGSTTQPSTARPQAFGMLPRPADDRPAKPTEVFQKSTPAQNEMAIAVAKFQAAGVAQKLGVNFQTLETQHFLIFTDWDTREYGFLKTNFEGAYDTVSRQFEIPSSDNVFVGKLPVYMFAQFKDYASFTDSLGFLKQPTPRTLRGYYEGAANGSGRMVMYKPADDNRTQAEYEWAHCLVHEFTHAFIARYRTNARIPRWLDEGIAEVIAAKNFPFPGTNPYAIRMAHQHANADPIFIDDQMPGGEWYPVMQTMVEMLLSRNHAALKQMVDDIKDGTDGEAALKKDYGIDYHQLVNQWRQALLHR
jgi:hypothetical protein